ncbi:MAG TPA: aldo/keto reductase [Amycolatopsis sp.]|uniref:aldo/keto reductase n=1 Tax=Amycolatopsis sp. TaxID=37632 RepID=UPI002B46BB22|nr:aldo/keto reductase [Amycolatopsis sp.]HKS47143.1 aldo/keto reductase [Amycolatopsis sp.]
MTLGEKMRASGVPLCLGTMHFGTSIDEPTAGRLLDHFVEAGGTVIDTANCYGTWVGSGAESEEVVGKWLRSGTSRDRVVVATKIGLRHDTSMQPWPSQEEGLSAKAVRQATEDSLRRLCAERIDLLYAHIDDRAVPLEETVSAFAELAREGLVGRLGLSNYQTARVECARAIAEENDWPRADCLQYRYTYLRPRPGVFFGGQLPAGQDLLDYVAANPDLTLFGYSPLLSGAYSRPDRPLLPHYHDPGNAARLAALAEVAREIGVTVNQVVLAWMIGGMPSVLPVIGVSTVEQLDECLAAGNLKLSEEHRARLDTAG